MRAAQKRNRGEDCPRGSTLFTRPLPGLDLDLVSQGFLSHGLFRTGVEGNRGMGFLCLSEFRKLRQGDVPGESERTQRPNPVPVWIDLIPGNAVSRCLGDGMMIVMPTFAKSKNGYPEAVGRIIARHETLRTPHVRGGVCKPRRVEAKNGSKEGAPQQVRQSAYHKQANAEHGQGNPVPLADPAMKFVFAKIGDIGQ